MGNSWSQSGLPPLLRPQSNNDPMAAGANYAAGYGSGGTGWTSSGLPPLLENSNTPPLNHLREKHDFKRPLSMARGAAPGGGGFGTSTLFQAMPPTQPQGAGSRYGAVNSQGFNGGYQFGTTPAMANIPNMKNLFTIGEETPIKGREKEYEEFKEAVGNDVAAEAGGDGMGGGGGGGGPTAPPPKLDEDRLNRSPGISKNFFDVSTADFKKPFGMRGPMPGSNPNPQPPPQQPPPQQQPPPPPLLLPPRGQHTSCR